MRACLVFLLLAATGASAAVGPGTPSLPADASPAVHHLVAWTVATADHGILPFAVVDKVAARVFVFDKNGELRGTAPVLLGLAKGDDSVAGIGNQPLSRILPSQRTTPAGRFVAALDYDLAGHVVLWVDYDAAISMHAVVTSNKSERRLERLATPTAADNRISYGCINVPAKFFVDTVVTTFTTTGGIVYVLPETRPVDSMPGLSAVAPASASGASPTAVVIERRAEKMPGQ